MPPQSVANFKKAEEEVANDFVDRIAEIRNPETGLVPNLEFEVGKWNYESEFCACGREGSATARHLEQLLL